MIAISVVIAVMNAILTCVLRVLKLHVEKHWTITDMDRRWRRKREGRDWEVHEGN